MKVIYQGPADTVDLPRLGITATRGEPIDVPTDTAEQLILQGWKTDQDEDDMTVEDVVTELPDRETTKTQEIQ